MPKLIERIVRSGWYVGLVIAIWVFMPEIRRIVDWRSTFHALSILSILPMASLVPGLFVARADWKILGVGFRRLMTLWLLGFGYAFVIALITHSPLASIFSFALFCLPIAFGFIIAAPRDADIAKSFDRLADASLIFVGVSALYGIYQYAAPPPWDTYWAQQANIEGSQGATVAFGFRIWGTLNSTGPFAEALMIAIVLNLRRLSLRRWYVGATFVPLALALALTSVRGMWVGVLIAILCYLALASNRVKAATSIAVIAIFIGAVGFTIASNVKDASSSVTSLSDRLATFGALGEDNSANARRGESAAALVDGFKEPLGSGLGALGTSAKLDAGGRTVVLDNGYLSRFVEMGVLGFGFFMATIVGAFVYAFSAYVQARRSGDRRAIDTIATAISFQAVFFYLEVLSDTHVALGGMLFWASVCVVSRYGAAVESSARPAMRTLGNRISSPLG